MNMKIQLCHVFDKRPRYFTVIDKCFGKSKTLHDDVKSFLSFELNNCISFIDISYYVASAGVSSGRFEMFAFFVTQLMKVWV